MKNSKNISLAMAVGIGAGLGVVFNNIALGVVIGMSIRFLVNRKRD